jgi:hypothetical protein
LNPKLAEESKGQAFEASDNIRNIEFFDKSELKPESSKNDDYF